MSYFIDRHDEPEKSLVDEGKVSAEGIVLEQPVQPTALVSKVGKVAKK
jgi:hypothetical protein